MAPTYCIPPELQPYIRFDADGSLVLLTSILGASTNWLLIRFLCAAFAECEAGINSSTKSSTFVHPEYRGSTQGPELHQTGDGVSVVFLSFLRDWEFWKAEARRVGGLDLQRFAERNRLTFIDGLSALFPVMPQTVGNLPNPMMASASSQWNAPQPQNSSRSPTPGHPVDKQENAISKAISLPKGYFTLTSPKLKNIEDVVEKAILHFRNSATTQARERRVLLVLDSPDILLASANLQTDDITPFALNATVLNLRRQAQSTVVSLAADTPLTSASEIQTPLESNHTSLVTGLAHVSSHILSLRLLDTGFAADVSGIVRISRGSHQDGEKEGQDPNGGKELLYNIRGDGTVAVFARGAALDAN